LVETPTNRGSAVWIEWIEPFLWSAAQIGAIDTPTTIVYEGLWLGLAWVWRGLNGEVADLAAAYELEQ